MNQVLCSRCSGLVVDGSIRCRHCSASFQGNSAEPVVEMSTSVDIVSTESGGFGMSFALNMEERVEEALTPLVGQQICDLTKRRMKRAIEREIQTVMDFGL